MHVLSESLELFRWVDGLAIPGFKVEALEIMNPARRQQDIRLTVDHIVYTTSVEASEWMNCRTHLEAQQMVIDKLYWGVLYLIDIWAFGPVKELP
jgi:hypothetical protein